MTRSQMGFDDLLKYINDLSMRIPLQETLQHAEAVYFHLVGVADTMPEVTSVLAGLEPSAPVPGGEISGSATRNGLTEVTAPPPVPPRP